MGAVIEIQVLLPTPINWNGYHEICTFLLLTLVYKSRRHYYLPLPSRMCSPFQFTAYNRCTHLLVENDRTNEELMERIGDERALASHQMHNTRLVVSLLHHQRFKPPPTDKPSL